MRPNFEEFTRRVGGWLKPSGHDSKVVVSTRIRLARNVRGYYFVSRLSTVQAEQLSRKLSDVVLGTDVAEWTQYVPVNGLDELERNVLMERHLISRELALAERPGGVVYGDDEQVGVMLNEEDHLRLQVLRSGFQVAECWKVIESMDRALEKRVSYEFNESLGYLTACPTNVGTGMRVSVMLHLPALGLVPAELKRVFTAAAKTNLAVRGLHGEGSSASGHYYQVSNQVTLGRSELQIMDDITTFVPEIVRFENLVREALVGKSRDRLRQRVDEACESLRTSSSVETEDAMGLLSLLRLGLDLDLLSGIDPAVTTQLLILIQAAHLQMANGRTVMESQELDRCRAELIRRTLAI